MPTNERHVRITAYATVPVAWTDDDVARQLPGPCGYIVFDAVSVEGVTPEQHAELA